MTTDMIGEIYGHKCVLSRASKGQCPVFLLIANAAEPYQYQIKLSLHVFWMK